MLMGDKYLAWERPGSVSYIRKVLKQKMEYCPTQSELQNVLHQKVFLGLKCHDLLLCQGASVWVPDPDAVWASAVILQDYSPGGRTLRLQLPDGKVTVDLKTGRKRNARNS